MTTDTHRSSERGRSGAPLSQCPRNDEEEGTLWYLTTRSEAESGSAACLGGRPIQKGCNPS